MKRPKTYANNELSSEFQHNFHVFVSFVSNTLHSGTIFFVLFLCVCMCVCVCAKPPCAGQAKNKSNKQKRNNFAELLYLLLPQQLLIDS